MQIEVVRFCREAKHVEAVANGGASSVTARLSFTYVEEGDSLVFHTSGFKDGRRGTLMIQCISVLAKTEKSVSTETS